MGKKLVQPVITPLHFMASYVFGHYYNELEFRAIENHPETGERCARMRFFGAPSNESQDGFIVYMSVEELKEKQAELEFLKYRPHVRASLKQIDKAITAYEDPSKLQLNEKPKVKRGLGDKQAVIPSISQMFEYLVTAKLTYRGRQKDAGKKAGPFNIKHAVVRGEDAVLRAQFTSVSPIFPVPMKILMSERSMAYARYRRDVYSTNSKKAKADNRTQLDLGIRGVRLAEAGLIPVTLAKN